MGGKVAVPTGTVVSAVPEMVPLTDPVIVDVRVPEVDDVVVETPLVGVGLGVEVGLIVTVVAGGRGGEGRDDVGSTIGEMLGPEGGGTEVGGTDTGGNEEIGGTSVGDVEVTGAETGGEADGTSVVAVALAGTEIGGEADVVGGFIEGIVEGEKDSVVGEGSVDVVGGFIEGIVVGEKGSEVGEGSVDVAGTIVGIISSVGDVAVSVGTVGLTSPEAFVVVGNLSVVGTIVSTVVDGCATVVLSGIFVVGGSCLA
ncbi:hypothetical protein BGW39_006321 [Mortierella sp. 14UC]|nr:hypothetical protein BGW39_006321 [Mortierella sp. 14UC]